MVWVDILEYLGTEPEQVQKHINILILLLNFVSCFLGLVDYM